MARKIDFRFDENFIKSFYEKREQAKKLDCEIKKMSQTIRAELTQRGMTYSKIGKYSVYIEPCYRPSYKFIELMKNKGYEKKIKESCLIKDFHSICDELSIKENDRAKYTEFWFDKLYVNKK